MARPMARIVSITAGDHQELANAHRQLCERADFLIRMIKTQRRLEKPVPDHADDDEIKRIAVQDVAFLNAVQEVREAIMLRHPRQPNPVRIDRFDLNVEDENELAALDLANSHGVHELARMVAGCGPRQLDPDQPVEVPVKLIAALRFALGVILPDEPEPAAPEPAVEDPEPTAVNAALEQLEQPALEARPYPPLPRRR